MKNYVLILFAMLNMHAQETINDSITAQHAASIAMSQAIFNRTERLNQLEDNRHDYTKKQLFAAKTTIEQDFIKESIMIDEHLAKQLIKFNESSKTTIDNTTTVRQRVFDEEHVSTPEELLIEFNKTTKSIEYQTWLKVYVQKLTVAEASIKYIEAQIKKHTYKNHFGQLMYNTDEWTKQEVTAFNRHLDQIWEAIVRIEQLETMQNKIWYQHWCAIVSDYELARSMRITNYYYNHPKSF